MNDAVNQHDGFNDIIEGVNVADENDDYYKLSDKDKFDILMKCFFIIQLYQVVEEEMPSTTFKECCAKASLLCQQQGWKSRARDTVMRWHQQFRVNELFSNLLAQKCKKSRLPPFLRDEDICNALWVFC